MADVEKANAPQTETVSEGRLEEIAHQWYDDPAHPRFWPTWWRWFVASVYAFLQTFVLLTSTTYVSAEFLVEERYGVSTQVATLGQSMFIVGNSVGAIFLGPVSDINGRKWVYVVSIALYAILNIGTALSRNMPMLVIFMFLIGAAGSTAVSNFAGTITDLFGDTDGASQAMALFVVSANAGPSIGSPVGEWIAENTNMGLNWIFWINVIIGGVFAGVLCFMPETLPALVIGGKKGVQTIENLGARKSTSYVMREIGFITTMAVKLMVFEPVITFLAIFNGFAYGLLFLYLDGVFDVFAVNNGLSYIGADLTYLNFIVGVAITFCIVPIQTWLYRRDRAKHGGKGRPEARFLLSLVLVWGFPISLLWFAFTSTGNTSYWSPIIAGTLLGISDPLLWLAMLSYVASAYPAVAASAMAAFLVPSFFLAAAFCHIGVIMFDNLSTQWAMAILGFCSLGFPALTYIIYFFGERIRARSKYALKEM